jgi:predicted nuclease with TOPRIM domain
MLKGMGLTEEQVDSIIEEHTSVTDALKEQAQKYKADAEKLPAIQKELDDLKAGGDDWEDKYNAEHKAFEDYKKDIESKAELSNTKDAYKALLKSQDISEKRIDTILKLTDFSEIKLTKDGKIANEEKVIDKIKEDWSDLIGKKSESGASVDTPPNGGKHYASKDEIMKIRDASERQKAISENLELFGY